MMLVVNAGSSSIKLAVFDASLHAVLTGSVTEIGGAGRLKIGVVDQACFARDHQAALALAFQAMAQPGVALADLTAAAHRVVHGGEALVKPARVTPEVIAQIEACVPLAPLHNPGNLTAIRALGALAPDLPQFASFDTAFHASNPAVAVAYALPAAERARGLRRYGFHGISYGGLVRQLRDLGALPDRLLALHLGNGASLCAIKAGVSVATTMGYSPLDGITMGTRSGGMDGNAVLRLAELHGVDAASRILNRESGLLGLGGHSDMRALHGAGTAEAAFAVEHFCYWAVRHAGSMIAAMGGLDGIAFTGGIGENDALVRGRIVDGLAWAGPCAVHIVAAEEERAIAADAMALLAKDFPALLHLS
ncbi:acetate kinase [Cypionkella aquatica]|uniref:Acetate kinase n=1 Tax=Cypionkella aquatica TaxID=1756042 RepID=A0AA37U4D3_9RHOB|nr:acetate kinase [Cypionkella aquatica]GLS87070.1 acetate kinase [Cypionkella aquatica]